MDNSCNKANIILGLLRRTLSKCSQRTKTLAYQSLVRPHLEYAATAWDPHTKRETKKLEQVQRRAARFVTNNYSTYQSVTLLLGQLNWQPLEIRRAMMRQTIMYRILNSSIAIPATYVTFGPPRTRAPHPMKLQHIRVRIDIYRYSFFPRTIIQWNTLPQHIVMSPTIATFKLNIAGYYSSQPRYCYPQYRLD